MLTTRGNSKLSAIVESNVRTQSNQFTALLLSTLRYLSNRSLIGPMASRNGDKLDVCGLTPLHIKEPPSTQTQYSHKYPVNNEWKQLHRQTNRCGSVLAPTGYECVFFPYLQLDSFQQSCGFLDVSGRKGPTNPVLVQSHLILI